MKREFDSYLSKETLASYLVHGSTAYRSMALDRPWTCVVPISPRKLVLRFLLPSAVTSIVVNVIANVISENLWITVAQRGMDSAVDDLGTTPVFFVFARVVAPSLIILHHILRWEFDNLGYWTRLEVVLRLRLWPRKYWLVICEALFSLAEVVVGRPTSRLPLLSHFLSYYIAGVILVPDAQGSLMEASSTTALLFSCRGYRHFLWASHHLSLSFSCCAIYWTAAGKISYPNTTFLWAYADQDASGASSLGDLQPGNASGMTWNPLTSILPKF